MAVVVLTGPGHAPGVTTTALGLGLSWPADVLVADCDRAPTQAVLAGYLRGVDAGHRGLGHALQAHRERRPLEDVIAADALALDDGAGVRRRFLPGFPHPGTVGLFAGAWPDLMAAFAGQPGDVIVDAGQVGAEGLPAAVTTDADAVLVVVRTSLVALVALRLYLPLVLEAAGEARTGLLLIGEGQPYSSGEVVQQFGVPVWASVDHDPQRAAVLSDGAAPPRRFGESGFGRSLGRAASSIHGRLAESRRLIGAPR